MDLSNGTPTIPKNVFEHIMTVVGNTPPVLKIRWAALLHDVGKPLTFSVDAKEIGHFYEHNRKSYDLTKDILTRFRFDNKMVRQISLLVKEHMSKLKAPKRSTLKRLINRVGVENIDNLLELQIADVKRPGKMDDVENLQRVKAEIKAILQEKEPMHPKELAIDGDDLKAMGIKPGKIMGKILAELMEKVIDNPELNTREDLLAFVEVYKHE